MAKRDRTCEACFAISFLLGVSFVFMGFVEQVMPYASLDAVLTREELNDEAIRRKTLDLLLRASGLRWFFWAAGGALLTTVSSIGYWNCRWRTDKEVKSVDPEI